MWICLEVRTGRSNEPGIDGAAPQVPEGTGLIGRTVHLLFCLFLKLWFKVWNRLEVTGIGNLPKNGPYVIVANHSSHLDAPALISLFPAGKGSVYPAAASDYFFRDAASSAFSVFCMNAFPFERKGRAAGMIQACRSLLSGDNVLIMFPEGTRTMTGEINEFKSGIGHILAGSQIPVVACRISGAFERHPRGSKFPAFGGIRIDIGQPRVYAGLAQGRPSAEIIARDLKYEVARLEAGPGRMQPFRVRGHSSIERLKIQKNETIPCIFLSYIL